MFSPYARARVLLLLAGTWSSTFCSRGAILRPRVFFKTARVWTRAWRFDTTDPAEIQTLSQSGFTLEPTDFRQSTLRSGSRRFFQSVGYWSVSARPAPP